MSIPCVTFKTSRTAHRHDQTSSSQSRSGGTSGRPPRNPVMTLDFSSDDDLDELPSIKTSTKQTSAMITLADSDSDPPEKESEVKEVKVEVNWSSTTAKPANFQPRQTEQKRRRRHHRPHTEEEDGRDDPQGARQEVSVVPNPSRARRATRGVEPFNYTIIRENKKLIKKHGAEYRLMDNDDAILFGNTMKEDDKCVSITEKVSVSPTEPPPEVVAVVKKQHRGKRVTINDPRLEKPHDERPAEVLGMCYVHLPDNKTKAKTFRISVPNREANFPITEARELSRIAEEGDPVTGIAQYTTAVASIGPDGQPVNIFGNVYKVDSVKNYVINDEQNNVIFMLYKTAENSFNIKGKHPFSPMTAFGLSLAIITD